MTKLRRPMQVSPKFADRLRDLQRKIRMANGDDISFRDLTENIVSNPMFNDLEKKLINKNLKSDLKIRFDMRRELLE